MLSVFGDESADGTQQRVFAVAGVIGPEDAWAELEVKWVARNGPIPFHATDCESGYGAYRGMSKKEREALYQDLATFLAESGLGGWGFAIDLIAQRQIFPDAPDIAYYKGFTEVLQAMKNCAACNNETVRFTFDLRRESTYNSGELYRMYSEMPEWQHITFPEISFVCSQKHPRVQIADLFAREAMKALDNKIGPVKRPMRKSWRALYDTGRFHIDAISIDWFESLKSQMAELEEQTGMSHDNYLRWLKEHKLQDSITNMFRFMEWTAKEEKK